MFLTGCGLLARNPFFIFFTRILMYNQGIEKGRFQRLSAVFGGKCSVECLVSLPHGSLIYTQ